MNFSEKYFYITIHFMPKYEEEFTMIEKNIYQNNTNGKLYRKRLLYDFGWGQEPGFELLPILSFQELIQLVEYQWNPPKKHVWNRNTKKELQEYDIYMSNLYGAVSVIMQDHVEALICFLTKKIDTDYFLNDGIRQNFECFSFSSSKMKEVGKFPGGNLTQSYEDVLNKYSQWKEISERVIEQVYR